MEVDEMSAKLNRLWHTLTRCALGGEDMQSIKRLFRDGGVVIVPENSSSNYRSASQHFSFSNKHIMK